MDNGPVRQVLNNLFLLKVEGVNLLFLEKKVLGELLTGVIVEGDGRDRKDHKVQGVGVNYREILLDPYQLKNHVDKLRRKADDIIYVQDAAAICQH